MRYMRCLVCVISILLTLTNCTTTSVNQSTTSNEYIQQPVTERAGQIKATLTPETYRDCGWNRTIDTWIDANENGVWDADEAPLAGVQFKVENTITQFVYDWGGTEVSGPSGTTTLDIFLGGCPEVSLEVIAQPPTGYRPTTPLRIASERLAQQETLGFGFTEQK